MQRERTGQLRLFCICGQKMRVSDDMYGRPGKCIACRQKIRIPRRDEVPKGVTEIHLKDHPEFLRRSSPRKVHLPDVSDGVDETPVPAMPEADETLSTIPLDVLEPMRVVCSITYKIEQRLKAMKKAGGIDHEIERAEWQGYLARAQAAREDLDDQLRQRLMEVAIELATTQEKIAEAGLSVRVGETDFASFRENIEKLRQRRDRLERRQANLRGWLNVHDPSVAGGYLDVSVDQIPGRGIRLTLPTEPDAPGSPLQIYLEDVRSSLESVERADRKLAEGERLASDGNIPQQGIAFAQAEIGGIKKRAVAAVDYARGRLNQLLSDCDSDLKSISSQMDLARGRLQVGDMDRGAFDRLERDLLRMRADLAKAKGLIRKAINAQNSRQVPSATGTFIQRIGPARKGDEIPIDAWVTWAAALALLVTIVLPAINNFTPLSLFRQQANPAAHWLISLPAGTALALMAFPFLPNAIARGFLVLAAWAIASLTTVWCYQHIAMADTALGQVFRTSSWLQPGAITYLLGLALAVLAAGVALLPAKGARWGYLLVVLLVGAGLWTLGMQGQHSVIAPSMAISATPAETGPANTYRTIVNLQNKDKNAMTINRNALVPGQIDLIVERKIGAESWQPLNESTIMESGDAAGLQGRTIAGGGTEVLALRLEPGVYRVSIRGAGIHEPVTQEFVLDPISTPPPLPEEMDEDEGSDDDDYGRPENGIGIFVELQGVIQSQAYPQFVINVRGFNGVSQTRRLALTDEVYGGWQIDEYDPSVHSLVLRKEDEILIIKQGEALELTE